MLTTIQSALAGRKTYLVSLGTIAYMILAYLLGNTADLDYKTIVELILAMTIRAGVSKGAG